MSRILTPSQRLRKRLADTARYHRKSGAGTFKRAADKKHMAYRKAIDYIRKNCPGALVAWANAGAVRSIYHRTAELKKSTGINYSVDHIVPLLSADVCGLHCEANLQILEFEHNRVKNCYWFERDNNVDIPFADIETSSLDLIPGLEDRSQNPPWRI